MVVADLADIRLEVEKNRQASLLFRKYSVDSVPAVCRFVAVRCVIDHCVIDDCVMRYCYCCIILACLVGAIIVRGDCCG